MDITYYPVFGNLRYVHVVRDTCSAFMYVPAMTGEKDSHAIEAMKSSMLVVAVSWALKTNMAILLISADQSLPILMEDQSLLWDTL